MSAQYLLRAAAIRRPAILWRCLSATTLAACVLLIQGCTPLKPPAFDSTKASDPDSRVAPAAYRSVVDGYSSQRPVDPLPWTERNQRVTPVSRKEGPR